MWLCGLATIDLLESGRFDAEIVAAPVFPGKSGAVYRSVVVARRGIGAATFDDLEGTRLAINGSGSWSGYHALRAHLAEAEAGSSRSLGPSPRRAATAPRSTVCWPPTPTARPSTPPCGPSESALIREHGSWRSRIGTRVTPLGAPSARRAPRRPWPLAIAAAALIALTAGTTYLLTIRPPAAPAVTQSVAAIAPAPSHDSANSAALAQPTPAPVPPSGGTLVSHATTKKNLSVAHVYDREISLLDSLVRTRREELDPKTVTVIERNLAIIDSAIAESRKALAKDPRSPLLNNRLDNVLGSKVELLRTIAFLPSQS